MKAEEWIQQEQESLWADLGWAINSAANGCWSMMCDSIARRIIEAARLVGPTSWRSVGTSLVLGDVWHTLYEVGGIETDGPTLEELEDLRALLLRQGIPPVSEESAMRWARTCEALRQKRTAAWIRGEDD